MPSLPHTGTAARGRTPRESQRQEYRQAGNRSEAVVS